jgi:hypothetical protein
VKTDADAFDDGVIFHREFGEHSTILGERTALLHLKHFKVLLFFDALDYNGQWGWLRHT